MRKTLLLTVLLLACTAWLMAQSTQPQGDPAQPQGPVGSSTVEGCLGGSAGSFTVTDQAGVAYQLQLPQGADASKLSQHIGEAVRVTGTMAGSGPNTTASAAAQAQTDAGASGKQPAINVSKMDKIGDACSNPQTSPSK